VRFLYRTSEQLHIANFFSGSDSEKLRDLQWLKNAVAVQELSNASIDALWEEATQRPMGDKVRVSIADLIYRNEESAQRRKNDKR
jgi:hypothetical protein